MKRFRKGFLALSLLPIFSCPVRGEETEEPAKPRIEFPSPDGQFAFRFTGDSLDEVQTFDLIDKRSKKKLLRVARHDPDDGPSSRFEMKVLWRSDSKAFAVEEYLWKRGTYVAVYLREGAAFREVKLPELVAEPTEKEKGGKEFPHIVELNSDTAKQWQKNGSLVVETESIQDGGGDGSITVNRTVVLGFQGGKAKILKSTRKVTKDKEG